MHGEPEQNVMDDDRPAEVVSTTLILALLAFLVLPDLGYDGLQERLLATAAVTVVLAAPIAVYMVYVQEGESHYFGPWGPGSLLLIAAVIPGVVASVWVADTYDLTGALYWIVLVVGLLASVAVGAGLRALLFDDWPPSRHERRNRDGGPPGGP